MAQGNHFRYLHFAHIVWLFDSWIYLWYLLLKVTPFSNEIAMHTRSHARTHTNCSIYQCFFVCASDCTIFRSLRWHTTVLSHSRGLFFFYLCFFSPFVRSFIQPIHFDVWMDAGRSIFPILHFSYTSTYTSREKKYGVDYRTSMQCSSYFNLMLIIFCYMGSTFILQFVRPFAQVYFRLIHFTWSLKQWAFEHKQRSSLLFCFSLFIIFARNPMCDRRERDTKHIFVWCALVFFSMKFSKRNDKSMQFI